MHLVIGFFLFVLVIIAAVLIVGAWIVVNLGRGLKRVIVGPSVKSQPTPAAIVNRAICPRGECAAENPAQAQFCRRCGEPMAARAVSRGMKVA